MGDDEDLVFDAIDFGAHAGDGVGPWSLCIRRGVIIIIVVSLGRGRLQVAGSWSAMISLQATAVSVAAVLSTLSSGGSTTKRFQL